MGKCPECGGSLVGRSDRKFCCDDCRNSYHNRKYRVENEELKKVNKILKTNYLILKDFLATGTLTESGRIRCKIASLLSRGFNFKYFTCIDHEKREKPKYFCYDIPYSICKKNYVIIYHINNNGNN